MSNDKDDLCEYSEEDLIRGLTRMTQEGSIEFFRRNPKFRETFARLAADQGETEAYYWECLAKWLANWVEHDRFLVDFMRAAGVEVDGMFHALKLAREGHVTRAGRSSGAKVTAQIKNHRRVEAEQNAARLWDGLTTIPEHNRVAVIAKRMGRSEPTVRGYLQETGRKKTKGR
jgi:hypothetical protein